MRLPRERKSSAIGRRKAQMHGSASTSDAVRCAGTCPLGRGLSPLGQSSPTHLRKAQGKLVKPLSTLLSDLQCPSAARSRPCPKSTWGTHLLTSPRDATPANSHTRLPACRQPAYRQGGALPLASPVRSLPRAAAPPSGSGRGRSRRAAAGAPPPFPLQPSSSPPPAPRESLCSVRDRELSCCGASVQQQAQPQPPARGGDCSARAVDVAVPAATTNRSRLPACCVACCCGPASASGAAVAGAIERAASHLACWPW
jgi:hypothetical protein